MNTLREAIAFTGQVTNLNSIMVAVTDAINRGATKILFDKAKPYILLQRPIKEGEEETTDEQDVYRTVRQNEILEIQVDDSKNAYTGFFDIFKTINDNCDPILAESDPLEHMKVPIHLFIIIYYCLPCLVNNRP